MAVIRALVGQDGAMSTDGDPGGPPAGGAGADQLSRAPAADRERAVNALAYPLAGTAAAAVVVVVVLAVIDPAPGRHVRGLLILLALVGLLAAACGWVRTVWHTPTEPPQPAQPGGPGEAQRRDVRHVE